MKKIHSLLLLTVILVINYSLPIHSQDDCLGISNSMMFFSGGIQGGYGIQKFNAKGFNHYIDVYNERRPNLTKHMDNFGTASGFNLGISPFQISIINWDMGFRLSYRFLSETNEATASVTGGTARREYDLTMKSIYFSTFFTYNISPNFAFKIIDAGITFTSVDLKNSLFQPELPTEEQKLTSVDNPLGGNISTGLIVYIIPHILSIDATVGYSLFFINEMEFEDGGALLQVDEGTNESMSNFIDGGGLYVFGQINISIPFE